MLAAQGVEAVAAVGQELLAQGPKCAHTYCLRRHPCPLPAAVQAADF